MSGHRVEMSIDAENGIRLEFICEEPEGAFCRSRCSQCSEWDEDHDTFEDHGLTHGECIGSEYLTDNWDSSHAAAFSGTDHPLFSGPIEITWDDGFYFWDYATETP